MFPRRPTVPLGIAQPGSATIAAAIAATIAATIAAAGPPAAAARSGGF